MKKYNKLIVGAILVFFLVIFSAINTNSVKVNFGFGSISSPLIFVILGSTLLGCLIVLLFSFSTSWQQRRELKRLREIQANHDDHLAAELAGKDEEIQELAEKYDVISQELAALQTPVYLGEPEAETFDGEADD